MVEIARAEGEDEINAFLDLTLADDLPLEFTRTSLNNRGAHGRTAEQSGDPELGHHGPGAATCSAPGRRMRD